MQLPNFPTTRQAVDYRAKREGWHVTVKKGIGARGRLNVYALNDLPKDLRTAIQAKTASDLLENGSYQMAVDFANLTYKPKTAVLVEHNGHMVAGVCTLSVTAEGLIAEGELLDNEYGNMVADASDREFPWEMSAYVQAARYEELAAGAKLSVNGHEVAGPALIMRDCTIREVSFTPVGVDGNTSAVALSNGKPFDYTPNQPQELSMNAEEQKAFDELKQEVETLKQENADLKKSKRKAQVNAKLSAAGFAEKADGEDFVGVSAATYTALLSAGDDDLAAMVADLHTPQAEGKQTPPAALLSDTKPPAEQDAPDGVKLSVATSKGSFGGQYV